MRRTVSVTAIPISRVNEAVPPHASAKSVTVDPSIAFLNAIMIFDMTHLLISHCPSLGSCDPDVKNWVGLRISGFGGKVIEAASPVQALASSGPNAGPRMPDALIGPPNPDGSLPQEIAGGLARTELPVIA